MLVRNAQILALIAHLLICGLSAETESKPTLTSDFIRALTNHDLHSAKLIYAAIREANQLEANAFRLAKQMKLAADRSETLTEESKRLLNELVDELPVSTRNAVFATTICIRNVFFDQYMFSSNATYAWDSNFRYAFLWDSSGTPEHGTWTLEPTATDSQWKVLNDRGEYLFTDTSIYILHQRQVFTYTPSVWPDDGTNVFVLTPVGDDVTLQSYYGAGNGFGHLYGSDDGYNYDAESRRFMSWDQNFGTALTNRWSIESC